MPDTAAERKSTLSILERLWGVLRPYRARVASVALLISFSAARPVRLRRGDPRG